MPFALQYLTRLEQTQALDKTTNPIAGMDSQSKPSFWMFDGTATGADVTAADVDAADYFLDAYAYLTAGDAIWCATNDPGGVLLLVASSTSSTVTTTLKSAQELK